MAQLEGRPASNPYQVNEAAKLKLGRVQFAVRPGGSLSIGRAMDDASGDAAGCAACIHLLRESEL